MTEDRTIAKARRGDREALRTLLQPHEQPLFHYLYRILQNADDARDALQNTLMKAIQKLDTFSGRGTFRGWLFRIAHHEAMDTIRQRQRLQVVEDVPEATPEGPREDSRLERAEARERLEAGIAALPLTERSVVWLRLREELTFREIAEMTDTPLNTVLARMHSAKKRLRTWMLEEVRP